MLRLIPDDLSTDTLKCCEQLVEMAKARKLRGIGFVGILAGGDFIGNTAGAAHSDPWKTRGLLLGLDDKLSARVHGGKPPRGD